MTVVENRYLAGNFGPVQDEVTAFDLPVHGELPEELEFSPSNWIWDDRTVENETQYFRRVIELPGYEDRRRLPDQERLRCWSNATSSCWPSWSDPKKFWRSPSPGRQPAR